MRNDTKYIRQAQEEAIAERTKMASDEVKLRDLLKVCSEEQQRLSSRVAYLETRNSSAMAIHPGGPALKYIKNFASRLFPTLGFKERLYQIFEILYGSRKSFRSYVKQRMKEELTPCLRMTICREIRKLFAPWRFLEIMDISKQSLNQVSIHVFFS